MSSEFTKDKVIWTKAMNLNLAKYLEDKPHIWDPKHPKITHIGLRDETFATFAAQYDGLSWQAVKDRWTNIRSTFSFYMRKINARKESGRIFKVGWFMWKPCKYLYKVHKPKPVKSTDQTAIENNEDGEAADASNDAVFSESSDDGRDTVSCEGIVNNIATVFKDVQNDTFEANKSKYASVGDAVTKTLSQLNSYEAAQLTQKITEILAEYDENNPMNPNGLRCDDDSNEFLSTITRVKRNKK